jgi:hypothetical protein
MAQTKMGWPLSFSLAAENRSHTKEQSDLRSALSSASCRRSGCSPAVPYPPHEYVEFSTYFSLPLQRGHLYFAELGTFLLCIDRLDLT